MESIVEKVIAALEEKEIKITKTNVKAVLSTLGDVCAEVLTENKVVYIPGVFKAELVQRAGRMGFNIMTKTKQEIAPHTACKISALGKLKDSAKNVE